MLNLQVSELHMTAFVISWEKLLAELRVSIDRITYRAFLSDTVESLLESESINEAILGYTWFDMATHFRRWKDISLQSQEAATQFASRLFDIWKNCFKHCYWTDHDLKGFSKENLLLIIPTQFMKAIRDFEPVHCETQAERSLPSCKIDTWNTKNANAPDGHTEW